MANVMLFYVGAVLFCNGLWLLGQIEDKEIKVIDTFVGCLLYTSPSPRDRG